MGEQSGILAEVGWKATYLFSLWYLSWLASQSIYDISIIEATGIQLTSNYMEFHKVLCFLFVIQKILYLEKQENRDLFQCRLHLKIKNKNILVNAFFPSYYILAPLNKKRPVASLLNIPILIQPLSQPSNKNLSIAV